MSEKERKALIRHIKEQGSTSLTSEELSEELENALFVARIRPALLEITEKN